MKMTIIHITMSNTQVVTAQHTTVFHGPVHQSGRACAQAIKRPADKKTRPQQHINMSIPASPVPNISGMMQLYNYNYMHTVYPWATTFRAGVILLCETANLSTKQAPNETDYQSFKMLMVWQKAENCITKNGSLKPLPARLGFPKGRQDDNDRNALQTALRELKEETSIDIRHDSRLHARIVVPSIIIPREGHDINEVLIFFIVIIKCEPKVQICDYELSGYEWINIATGLRGLSPTTTPTAGLLKLIEDIDFWGPINTIRP